MRPAEDEIVLPKGSSSVFGSTNIGYLLRNMVRLSKESGARFSQHVRTLRQVVAPRRIQNGVVLCLGE